MLNVMTWLSYYDKPKYLVYKKDYYRWRMKVPFWYCFPVLLYCCLQTTDFSAMYFSVLLPNKDTWMHHVTFMTCEVLKGAKVKGWFHGRVALRFLTVLQCLWTITFVFPFPFQKQLCLCAWTSCSLWMENWTFVIVSVILNATCDYKWFLPHQCTIRATVVQQGALKK